MIFNKAHEFEYMAQRISVFEMIILWFLANSVE